MVWLDLCRLQSSRWTLALSLAGVFVLASLPARADMQVLASNVAGYPRDAILKGSSIDDLKRGQWVRVMMLETKRTRYFGDPPLYLDRTGTRRPRPGMD
jgi:hypothetical protein